MVLKYNHTSKSKCLPRTYAYCLWIALNIGFGALDSGLAIVQVDLRHVPGI